MDSKEAMAEKIGQALPDLLDNPIFAVEENLVIHYANKAFLERIDPKYRSALEISFLDIYGDSAVTFVRDVIKKVKDSAQPMDMKCSSNDPKAAHSLFRRGARFRVLPMREEGSEPTFLFIALGRKKTSGRAFPPVDHSPNQELVRILTEGISRDFNNILEGLLGNVGLLKAQVDRDQRLRGPIDRIESAALRGVALARQLRASIHGDKGNPRQVDLGEITLETVEEARGMVEEDVKISLTVQDDLEQVNADPVLLKQMIMNLLRNAWEAMPGGGTITLGLENRSLEKGEIKELRGGDYVVLSVRDEGIGIDVKDLPRIFDPFYTTKSLCRGLGLSAVKGIVNALKGRVHVKDTEAGSTEFSLIIPSWKSTSRERASMKSSIAGSRIMVVDGDPVVRDFCTAAFQSVGAQVTALESGREAFDLLARDPGGFDLILLDSILSELSAEETFRRMRRIRPDLKIALCSDRPGKREELEEKGLLKHAAAFLEKPFDIQELLNLVYRIRRRSRRDAGL